MGLNLHLFFSPVRFHCLNPEQINYRIVPGGKKQKTQNIGDSAMKRVLILIAFTAMMSLTSCGKKEAEPVKEEVKTEEVKTAEPKAEEAKTEAPAEEKAE